MAREFKIEIFALLPSFLGKISGGEDAVLMRSLGKM